MKKTSLIVAASLVTFLVLLGLNQFIQSLFDLAAGSPRATFRITMNPTSACLCGVIRN